MKISRYLKISPKKSTCFFAIFFLHFAKAWERGLCGHFHKSDKPVHCLKMCWDKPAYFKSWLYLITSESWKLNLNKLFGIQRSMMITRSAYWLGNHDACSVTCLEDISFVHASCYLTDQSRREALWSKYVFKQMGFRKIYLSFLWTHKKLISTISVAIVFVRIVAGMAEMNPTIFFVVDARTAQSQSVCQPGGLKAHLRNSGE